MLLLLDMSPGEGGSVGQVIAYTHDPDEIVFVAASVGELLAVSARVFEEDGEEVLEGVLEEME